MKTQIIATYASGAWTYSVDGANSVSGGAGNLTLPWFYMNDYKQQFLNHSISVQWSGVTGSGSYNPKQTLEFDADAAPSIGTSYNIATATNSTDINKHNFINELCTGTSINITLGTISAAVVTITILIDDIVKK